MTDSPWAPGPHRDAPPMADDRWHAGTAPIRPSAPAATPAAVPGRVMSVAMPAASAITGPPTIAPAAGGATSPSPTARPWGWRSFVAFLAGGALTAGGFALGAGSGSPDSPEVVASPSSTTPSVVVQPPAADTEDPAAFVAAVLGPSVVQVEHEIGLGSGVVIAEGIVLTNNHVIEEATEAGIKVRTSEGRVVEATLLGGDPRTDIAVLDVGPDAGLPVADLAVDDPLEVGQYVVAIGSPFQLQQTVTSGIVSAVNRPIQTSASVVNAMIQTDAAINPGNSGGALADREARVVGINTSIQTDGVSASNVGVSFAVPIDVAVNVAQRIIDGESLNAGFLGVVGGEPSADGAAGVVIGQVEPDTAADAAGLRAGDRVIRVDDAPVATIAELAGLVQTRFPGDELELELVRDGETVVVTAVLGER
ncbi:MAG: S1C family serine protease [Acidimicrobiales bacterium]